MHAIATTAHIVVSFSTMTQSDDAPAAAAPSTETTPPPVTEDIAAPVATATNDETTDTDEATTSSSSTTNKKERLVQDLKQRYQTAKASSTRAIQKSVENLKQKQQEKKQESKNNADSSILYSDSIESGVTQLQKLVEEKRSVEKKNAAKWDFESVPAAVFGKTLKDVFVAFVKWGVVEENEDTVETTYNITKAFARLESYASWMHANATSLEGLSTASVKEAWEAWKFQLSHDTHGRLVWWINVAAMEDLDAIKGRDLNDTLRLFVWLAHYILLDTKAQDFGMVVANCMGRIKFWTGMTLVPPKLLLKLDRLSIGVLPIKVKSLFLLESPVWCNVMVQLLKPIVGKKVRGRIQVLEDNAVLEEALGDECIPEGFATLNGKLDKDLVYEEYFAKVEATEVKDEKEEEEEDAEMKQI